jgi:hypothetical protein
VTGGTPLNCCTCLASHSADALSTGDPRTVISLGIESRDYVSGPLLKRIRRWRPISCKQVRTAGRSRERRHCCAPTGSQECSAMHFTLLLRAARHGWTSVRSMSAVFTMSATSPMYLQLRKRLRRRSESHERTLIDGRCKRFSKWQAGFRHGGHRRGSAWARLNQCCDRVEARTAFAHPTAPAATPPHAAAAARCRGNRAVHP